MRHAGLTKNIVRQPRYQTNNRKQRITQVVTTSTRSYHNDVFRGSTILLVDRGLLADEQVGVEEVVPPNP